MLDKISADDFRKCLNQTFRIEIAEGEPLEAELVDVRGIGGDTLREDRSPFSVLFRGPADAPLEQSIFRLQHDSLGPLDLFLVTVGPDPDDPGMLYEAVFT